MKRNHDILSRVIAVLLVFNKKKTDINWACTFHATCLHSVPSKQEKRKFGGFHLMEPLLSRILRLLPKASHRLWLL